MRPNVVCQPVAAACSALHDRAEPGAEAATPQSGVVLFNIGCMPPSNGCAAAAPAAWPQASACSALHATKQRLSQGLTCGMAANICMLYVAIGCPRSSRYCLGMAACRGCMGREATWEQGPSSSS